MRRVDNVKESLRRTTICWKKQLEKWISHLAHTISGMILVNESGTTRFVHKPHTVMEGAMHDSRTIANRLLAKAKAEGRPLTPMQVLKLVYIAHGWMLGLYGRPLINDRVEAWQYGPVIPRLYNAMRHYRGESVSQELSESANDPDPDKYERDVIRQVYDLYGDKSGPALSRLTHAKGTPWHLTYVPGEFGVVIPTDIIQDHYEQLAAK